MTMTTAEVARRYQEAMNSKDREAQMALFAYDAVYTAGGPARGSRYEGKAAISGAMDRAMFKVFEVSKLEVEEIIVAKDHFFVPINVVGKSRITGRPYANKLLLMETVKDGKIVHQHEYLDTIASARATGDIPYPD